MSKSVKQIHLEKMLTAELEGKARQIAEDIFNDSEVQALQDYANVVSIKRLGFNDHGPVHMRKAAWNAIKMFELLSQAGIKFNLEAENIASSEDSLIVVLIASLLHDIGMSVSRQNHEIMSINLGTPIIRRILQKFYPEDVKKQVIMRSMIYEGIVGHMATQTIHSLEAGLVLIGDGCDMEKGRARITTMLANKPKVGDIHKYSANAIEKVTIGAGNVKPIQILVKMSQSVGLFQVEEVLFTKIASSPVKKYIELYAQVRDNERLKYL
ncbi:MAG TPA: phosphohydrolase [Candidatus Cloacimonas sp.]|nr:phosphohydrolase [Candidatus Cloacimonas sp.]